MVFNIGINDLGVDYDSYVVWYSMLRRCYSAVYQQGKPTYIGTTVSPDWHWLSNFDQWFQKNYIQDWQLDKELLSNFSKVYSKDTCCFLPNEINSALYFDRGKNGLPPGVSYKTSNQNYIAQYSRKDEHGKRKSVHLLSSSDPQKCFQAYKVAKENYLKELADRFQAKLDPLAYRALMELKI